MKFCCNKLFLIFTMMPVLTMASLYDWWEEPYGNDEFNSNVLFNENVTLSCTNGNDSDTLTPAYWILPDLYVMKADDVRSFLTLDGLASWTVSSDTMEMHATLVQPEHFGFYYCVLEDKDSNQTVVVKKSINYEGPYFGSVWDNYETNFIIGISASGGFLLIVSILYGIYLWKYADFEDDEDDSEDSDGSSSRSMDSGDVKQVDRHPNQAYDGHANQAHDGRSKQAYGGHENRAFNGHTNQAYDRHRNQAYRVHEDEAYDGHSNHGEVYSIPTTRVYDNPYSEVKRRTAMDTHF